MVPLNFFCRRCHRHRRRRHSQDQSRPQLLLHRLRSSPGSPLHLRSPRGSAWVQGGRRLPWKSWSKPAPEAKCAEGGACLGQLLDMEWTNFCLMFKNKEDHIVIKYHITTSTNLPTNKFAVRVELWHRIYRIWKLSNHNVISSSGMPLPALAINPHFPPPSRFCVYACRSSVCIYMHICMHSFFCDFPYFVG